MTFTAPDIDYAGIAPIIALTAGLVAVLLGGLVSRGQRVVVSSLSFIAYGAAAGLLIWQFGEDKSLVAGALRLDDLATRGSAWALLRYAAGRKSPAQQPIWFSLVNNVEVGLVNFTKVFGEGVPRVRDWTVSVYTDDALPGVPERFLQPSWNYRSIYPALASGYPLATRPLTGSAPTPVTLAGGGAVFFRFGVTGSASVVRLTSQGGSVPATVEAALMRTR